VDCRNSPSLILCHFLAVPFPSEALVSEILVNGCTLAAIDEVDGHDADGPELPRTDQCPLCGSLLADAPPAQDAVPKPVLPEHISTALMRTPSLSPREKAVFELLGLGYDNRSLARTLEVSERTAKRHVTAILNKLGLKSRLQAGLTALLAASLRPESADGPKVAWTSTSKADDTKS
jgi:DNA-binding CsgD family transcriptional regulator